MPSIHVSVVYAVMDCSGPWDECVATTTDYSDALAIRDAILRNPDFFSDWVVIHWSIVTGPVRWPRWVSPYIRL